MTTSYLKYLSLSTHIALDCQHFVKFHKISPIKADFEESTVIFDHSVITLQWRRMLCADLLLSIFVSCLMASLLLSLSSDVSPCAVWAEERQGHSWAERRPGSPRGKMAAIVCAWASVNTYHQHQPGPNPILSLPQVTSYTGTEERHFQTKVSPIGRVVDIFHCAQWPSLWKAVLSVNPEVSFLGLTWPK